jgi:hypothetical protein
MFDFPVCLLQSACASVSSVPRNAVFRTSIWWLGALFCLSALALSASASKRIRVALRYVPGDALRYRIESRTTTSGKITTPILNPEGARQSILSMRLLVRLDVLDPPAGAAPGAVRFRATYEECHVEFQSDAFDPAEPSPSAPYAHLQGRSLDFTVEPGGNLADLKGLEDLFPDPAQARATLSWFDALSLSSRFPATGIEIGQRWKSERQIDGAPVSDLIWRAESGYLRDEPCPLDTGATNQASAADNCVAILTHFTISRRGSPSSDATPDDYLHSGLRVSGEWTGSGERLDSISVSRGVLIRSTQSSDQQMDYRITRAATGASIHNQSHVQFQSEASLVPAASH